METSDSAPSYRTMVLQKDAEYRDLFWGCHCLLQIGKGVSVLLFCQVLNASNDLRLNLLICFPSIGEPYQCLPLLGINAGECSEF